jgi:hypothetical protein
MWEPDYVTRDQFKNYVRIELQDTVDDQFIDLDITSASRAVDSCCSYRPNGMGAKRQFGQVAAPEARYYTPRWDTDQARWVIEIDDLMDTSVTIAVDLDRDDVYEGTITDFVLRPRDAVVNKRPYTQISISPNSSVQPFSWPDSARVTALWGWSAVPSVVVRATLIQAHRFNKRRTAPFGVAGSSNNSSEVSMATSVDPDVESMLHTNNLCKLVWTT